MKLLCLSGALLLTLILTVPQATPASAQVGVYIGPGGADVRVGPQGPRRRHYDERRRSYYGDGYDRPPLRCRTYYVQRGPYTERIRECY